MVTMAGGRTGQGKTKTEEDTIETEEIDNRTVKIKSKEVKEFRD